MIIQNRYSSVCPRPVRTDLLFHLQIFILMTISGSTNKDDHCIWLMLYNWFYPMKYSYQDSDQVSWFLFLYDEAAINISTFYFLLLLSLWYSSGLEIIIMIICSYVNDDDDDDVVGEVLGRNHIPAEGQVSWECWSTEYPDLWTVCPEWDPPCK